MSEPQDEIKAVTTGKDPKRVQWGKELGKKNKGRKKSVEPSDTYNNKIMMGVVGIGILSIAVFLYFKKSETIDDIKQEPFKKQVNDLTI